MTIILRSLAVLVSCMKLTCLFRIVAIFVNNSMNFIDNMLFNIFIFQYLSISSHFV